MNEPGITIMFVGAFIGTSLYWVKWALNYVLVGALRKGIGRD